MDVLEWTVPCRMQFARDAKENELISCFLSMDLRKLHSYMSVILEAVVKCS